MASQQPVGTHLVHGGYALRSRFEIVQHHYAGGPGYVEVLEIKDPPPGKHPIVLCHYGTVWDGGPWRDNSFQFWEFRTVEAAREAMDIVTGSPHLGPKGLERIRQVDGLLHVSDISESAPWFYAEEGEPIQLFGDFVV